MWPLVFFLFLCCISAHCQTSNERFKHFVERFPNRLYAQQIYPYDSTYRWDLWSAPESVRELDSADVVDFLCQYRNWECLWFKRLQRIQYWPLFRVEVNKDIVLLVYNIEYDHAHYAVNVVSTFSRKRKERISSLVLDGFFPGSCFVTSTINRDFEIQTKNLLVYTGIMQYTEAKYFDVKVVNSTYKINMKGVIEVMSEQTRSYVGKWDEDNLAPWPGIIYPVTPE